MKPGGSGDPGAGAAGAGAGGAAPGATGVAGVAGAGVGITGDVTPAAGAGTGGETRGLPGSTAPGFSPGWGAPGPGPIPTALRTLVSGPDQYSAMSAVGRSIRRTTRGVIDSTISFFWILLALFENRRPSPGMSPRP